ncbi:class I SAM-dependent methyltransferase [Candidatus Beckwithbacteria bacterium]|nr:class I SAM-dependent methyltransferase [Candidatus Beckwithbacteria bacterium]
MKLLQKNKLSKKIIYKIAQKRTQSLLKKIEPFLKEGDKILDIGAGTCSLCEDLEKKDYQVFPLDVQNLSLIDHINPLIYNGDKIPYENDEFNKALILTVLHHTKDPEKIIKEAKRVAKEIIIIEDVYSNPLHQYITYFFDSLLNFEFFNHPHSNKNNREWQETFEKLGLKLLDTQYHRSFFVFKHATYYLQK